MQAIIAIRAGLIELYSLLKGDAEEVAAIEITALNVSDKTDDKAIIAAARAETQVEADAVVIDTDKNGVKKVFFYKSKGWDFLKDQDGNFLKYEDGSFYSPRNQRFVRW